jgi:hypothetical protein
MPTVLILQFGVFGLLSSDYVVLADSITNYRN